MFKVANATLGTVGVKILPLGILTSHLRRELTSRCAVVYAVGLRINGGSRDVIFLHGLIERCSVNAFGATVDQSALVKLVQDAEDAASTTTLLHTVFLRVGSELTQTGHMTAQAVNVLHLKVGTSLLSHSQEMEHGVGAAAHGDVESHGVEESIACGNVAWQHTLIAILIIGHRVLHDLTGSLLEQLYAVLVRGKDGSVAGQRQANGLCERVHRVGCEHA